jgi:general secretion pathway protein K
MSVRDHAQIQRSGLVFEQDLARSLLLGGEVIALRLLEQLAGPERTALG